MGIRYRVRQILRALGLRPTFEPKAGAVSGQPRESILLVTLDSCRYDAFVEARTPYLASVGQCYRGWSQATYTYPAHLSFFVGMFPLVHENVPYLNRFTRQLISMRRVGAPARRADLGDRSIVVHEGCESIVEGLARLGYSTIGAAGTNWFQKEFLRRGFQRFRYEEEMSLDAQWAFLAASMEELPPPYFLFLNLIETHSPYMHYGDPAYSMSVRKDMTWPPDSAGVDAERAARLYRAQVEAVEYLDGRFAQRFPTVPGNALVLLFGDHGDCFGEDGFWGHGFYHPKVMEVPCMLFSLGGPDPLADEAVQTKTEQQDGPRAGTGR